MFDFKVISTDAGYVRMTTAEDADTGMIFGFILFGDYRVDVAAGQNRECLQRSVLCDDSIAPAF